MMSQWSEPRSLRRVTRRAHRLISTLGALLVAACAADRSGRDARSLVAALESDPGHLNPAITTNGGIHTASGLLYDGLIALDSTLSPVPALAERWEVLDGGARYRFHLRRGVRWHDGKAFTAADVKFTFDSLLLRFHARTRASMSPALLSVDAPDDSTVEFRFRRPYAPLLQQLDVVEAPMLPRHLYAGSDPLRNSANIAPVGTGPYRFVAYDVNNEIRYTANSDYFGGVPAIRDVILRVIPDAATRVIALEAGEIDWLYAVPGPDRERLRRDKRVRLVKASESPGGSNCITTVGFNLDRPWFRDVRVRRAIAHAVNREQFVERVLFGDGRAADAPISSRIRFAYRSDLPIPAFDTRRGADERDDLAHDGTPLFLKGENIGQDLAGVLIVRERVDRRNAGMAGEVVDVLLGKGADDRAMDHAAEDTGGVLDRLAAAELDVAGIEEKRPAAKFMDADLEADAGAGGRLGEDQRPCLAGEGFGSEAAVRLEGRRGVQHVLHVRRGHALQTQKMFHRTVGFTFGKRGICVNGGGRQRELCAIRAFRLHP